MYNDFLEFNELPRETIVRFNESVLHEYVKLKPGNFATWSFTCQYVGFGLNRFRYMLPSKTVNAMSRFVILLADSQTIKVPTCQNTLSREQS